MDIQPVNSQAQRPVTPALKNAASVFKLTQDGFAAQEPFAAYLLTLSDPVAQALSAMAKASTAPATGNRAGLAAAALLASGASTVLGDAATADLSVPFSPATVLPAASAALATAQLSLAAGNGTDTTATATTAPAVAAATGADPADAARAADASAAFANQTAQLASDASAAANAAAVADAAAGNALAGANAANAVAEGSGDLAVDATAKFMGAGVLAAPDRALAGAAALEDIIPAVARSQAATAMAAYTGSNPQARTPAQPPQVPALNAAQAFELDIRA